MKRKQILPPVVSRVEPPVVSRVEPPLCLLASILIMVALHFLLPVGKVIPSPWNYAGGLLVLVGVVLNIWSSNLFRDSKTTIKPFERSDGLVTNGPYRFSRHPMYLGMAMSLAGTAVLLGTITPAVVVPAFILVVAKKFINVEEKAMEDTFGEAYLEYKKRVRRWL